MKTSRVKPFIGILLSIQFFVFPGAGIAAEDVQPKTLRVGVYTGYPEKFPQTKGLGWADAYTNDIFAAAGYAIEVTEYPSKRMATMLSTGVIDIFVSSPESMLKNADEFLQSEMPAALVAYNIYYKLDKGWEPRWPPDEIFKQKVGKSKVSSASLKAVYGLNVTQAPTFDSIIKMVNKSRADYWIDNRSGSRNSTPGLIKLENEGFAYQPIFKRIFYMYFQNTDRGKALLKVYNKGFREIVAQGELITTYYKYDSNFVDTNSGEDLETHIREYFPNISVPKQLMP